MEFEADRLREDLAAFPCRFCHHVGARAEIRADGDHFADLRCRACNMHLGYLRWPPAPQKRERRRTARRAAELTRLGDDHCELCLRNRFQLPPPDTIEIHHLDENATNDDATNLRLYCTGCHQLVHWLRTYFGHYAAA